MVINIYMAYGRYSNALFISYLGVESNRRHSALECDALPNELLGLDHVATTYVVLMNIDVKSMS